MPVAPGLGRYFLPLNRGKRSVVLDLKTEAGRARSASLLGSADIVVHNYVPERARAFGLGWDDAPCGAPGARRRSRLVVRSRRPARRCPGLRPRRPGPLGLAHRTRRAWRHGSGSRGRDPARRSHCRLPARVRGARRARLRTEVGDRRARRRLAPLGRARGAGAGPRLARRRDGGRRAHRNIGRSRGPRRGDRRRPRDEPLLPVLRDAGRLRRRRLPERRAAPCLPRALRARRPDGRCARPGSRGRRRSGRKAAPDGRDRARSRGRTVRACSRAARDGRCPGKPGPRPRDRARRGAGRRLPARRRASRSPVSGRCGCSARSSANARSSRLRRWVRTRRRCWRALA